MYTHAWTSTFNNVAKVNHLGPSSNYHLFKQGIRPEWEDEANAEGGKFGIQFPKNKAGDAINEYWMYLVRSTHVDAVKCTKWALFAIS